MAEINHLIRPYEVGESSRPCDADDSIVERAIEEAELLDIKPKMGDATFMQVVSDPDRYSKLLDGGEYVDGSDKRLFAGLRRALAYYVWGRCVKNGVIHLTRFGFVQKRDEYSVIPEYKQQQTAYNDAFATADGYMKECLAYIQANAEMFPHYTQGGKIKANRVVYRIIGE